MAGFYFVEKRCHSPQGLEQGRPRKSSSSGAHRRWHGGRWALRMPSLTDARIPISCGSNSARQRRTAEEPFAAYARLWPQHRANLRCACATPAPYSCVEVMQFEITRTEIVRRKSNTVCDLPRNTLICMHACRLAQPLLTALSFPQKRTFIRMIQRRGGHR